MTPEVLSELARYPAFPEGVRIMISIIGIDAAACLIAKYPGQVMEIPTLRSIESGRQTTVFQRLSDDVGLEAARKIVLHWGGDEFPIPSCKTVIYQRLQEIIRAQFDTKTTTGGMTAKGAIFELGVEHNISARAINRILKRPGTGIQPQTPNDEPRPQKRRPAAINEAQGVLF